MSLQPECSDSLWLDEASARRSVLGEFAIEVAVSKYLDLLPLERQVRMMGREGLEIDSQSPVKVVFISGSRRIRRLSREVRERLDRMVEKRLPLVIGDANGADLAVQEYLSSRGYGLVEVFIADETPRHNVGRWPLRRIQPSHKRRDFDYYASKDREMAREAAVGFSIWDGESLGTLMNVLRLVALEKTAVVYIEPEKTFSEVRTRDDFERLARGLNPEASRKLHEQAVREGLFEDHPVQAPLRL